ncbi:hypothetical protein EU538_05915 [Candidatus Thorarchaeota archaeon]|nr:MAG: hypothetical protein EU538_05915 [Candidatus Thorarchaeota archaeon]
MNKGLARPLKNVRLQLSDSSENFSHEEDLMLSEENPWRKPYPDVRESIIAFWESRENRT